MSIGVRLEETRLDPAVELGALLEQAAGDGAVVSFVGTVRPESEIGDSVETLILE
jgi:molybdopterin synthase catalytic subunit